MMKNEENKVVAAILSVSLLTVMAGAVVAPALSSLAKTFSGYSTDLVKLIVTLPPLLVIPTALLIGKIADRLGRRFLLLVGLALYFLGGVGGAFSNSFYTLLFFRGILGVAVGIVMPISTGLVSNFFHGIKAQQMMGRISAANHFGGMSAQFISGALALFSWRYSFGVYGIALIAFMLVLFWLPEPSTQGTRGQKKEALPLKTYLYGFYMLLLMLVFYTVPLNISLFVEGTGLGSSTASGVACAVATGAPFIVGLYYQAIQDITGRYAVFLAICVMGLGMLIVGETSNLLILFLGTFLVGVGEGYLFPHLMDAIRSTVTPRNSVRALGIMSSMLYLGQFLSPIVVDTLGSMCVSPSLRQPFFVAWGLCAFAATISFALLIKQRA
ncbi:MFS transporter [Halodesulfovibrio sp.]|uniref:MFS transporter n=1 Tax=Halodesulfovibrio sp. TaxID=1912772 RepID=UPI0025BAB7F0|nr:MFS transporter [Halodesulfovibrio sp.]